MKKYLSSLAALALLFACQPENNPGGTGNNGKDDGGNKEVVATAIKLSTNDLTLEKGGNEILTVTFTPSNTTKKDVTWVSSNTGIATVADGIVVGVAPGSTEVIAKCGDATDKCKVTVVFSATGIKLSKTSLELVTGDSETLVATVEPEGSTDSVTWESSDKAVATVTDGVVTAVRAGEAMITAKAGNQKAECKVYVFAVPGTIDLGLSVKWASFNLGASAPEEYGYYYAWGETEPKSDYSWSTYKLCNGASKKLIKYCPDDKTGYWDGSGSPDNKTVLDPDDDAAHAALGGKWRMPTYAEWTELCENCTWTRTSDYNGTGVAGKIVTSNKAGYTDKSIFLPAAGYREDSTLSGVGSFGNYWSSSLRTSSPSVAWSVYFESSRVEMSEVLKRSYGFSVRPVSE